MKTDTADAYDIQATIDRLGMREMFERADRDRLAFLADYQELIFSPDELRREFGNRKFRWGAVNWRLISPADELKRFDARVTVAVDQRNEFARRFGLPVVGGTP